MSPPVLARIDILDDILAAVSKALLDLKVAESCNFRKRDGGEMDQGTGRWDPILLWYRLLV